MKKGLRLFLNLALSIVFLIAGCGGGNGTSSPTTTTQAGVAVVKIIDASASSASTIAVAADKYGKERIALVGNKDASGTPISLAEVYYSTLGAVLKIELGADGLPSVVSDQVGNKFTLTNYTANTVDLTFFDHEGGRIVGPSTMPIDSARLASLKKTANTRAQKEPIVMGVLVDDYTSMLEKAGNTLDIVNCGIDILDTTALIGGGVTIPLGVAMGTFTALNCGVTIAQTAGIIHGIKNPLLEQYSLGLDIVGSLSLKPDSMINLAINGVDYFVGDSPPEKPTGLAVYPNYASNKIFWKAPYSDTSISGYSIYRDDTYRSIGNAQSAYFEDVNVNPGSRYCYQIQAYSKKGNYSEKSDQQCVTVPAAVPPTATTGSATNITSSSVTLNGVVNTNSAAADAFFEFGTSVSYGNQAGGLSLAGNGSSSIMTTDLSGLVPNKTYHYRVVAKNSGITSYGSDQTFQTIAPVTAAPTISSVSPVTGSDSAQPFTINGSNFVSGAIITLRDKRTGEVFPNRQPTSFTNTKITLSTRFSTVAGTWSINVINPDNSSTGEYLFSVTAPPAGSLTTPTNTMPGSISSPGPTTSGSAVALSWFAVSGATYYDLGVTDIATGLLVVDTTSSGTAYSANLSAGKQYRWNVAACNSVGCSNYTTPLYFQTPAAPTVTPSVSSLSPTSMTANGQSQNLVIYGSNFASGNVVQFKWGQGASANVWTNSNATPTVNSSGQITVSMNPGTVTDTIYVRVCSSNGSSNYSNGTQYVSVTAPTVTPSVSSASPTSMTASTTALTTVTVNGSNFSTSGGYLKFTDPLGNPYYSTGHPERVVSVTSTQWVYRINNGGTVGTWKVQVVNSDGQASNAATFTVY